VNYYGDFKTVQQALDGITVVDFSHVVAGPTATHFLALNGARVIKIEPPTGDPLRNYTINAHQAGMAPAFQGINAGKESICLNLKTKEGKAHALDLIADADILVENFRPGVMDRLGLGYEHLQTVNSALIYCSVSGFGQNGDMKSVAAIDQIVQSMSGLMQLSGQPDDPSLRVGFPIVDTYTGLMAAFAIQTALVQRERGSKQGQLIDVAMLDATFVMLSSVINPMLLAGEQPVRTGNRGFSRAPTADTFETAQGEITVGAVEDQQVSKLLGVLGLGVLLDSAEFSDRRARLENADAMSKHLSDVFKTKSAVEWVADLQAVGVPAAQVLTVDEALALPHLKDRDVIMNGENGERWLNAGFEFRAGGPKPSGSVPKLGADTNRILKEVANKPTAAQQRV
jgi:CoA:oxalate CoA-transferase